MLEFFKAEVLTNAPSPLLHGRKGSAFCHVDGIDGLFTRDEMDTNCCYANQNKTWVADPDGNEWEAFVVLQDNLPEQEACAATCCAPAV